MPAPTTSSPGEVSATEVPLALPGAWLVAGILPVLWQPSAAGAIAWGVAVVVGGFIARSLPIRWVALAWIAWAAIPGAPFMAIVASGVVAGESRNCVYAAVLGCGLCLIGIPSVGLNAGALLILAGCLAALWGRR